MFIDNCEISFSKLNTSTLICPPRIFNCLIPEKDEVLKSSRLRLLKCVERVLENSLKILGIKSVDEM